MRGHEIERHGHAARSAHHGNSVASTWKKKDGGGGVAMVRKQKRWLQGEKIGLSSGHDSGGRKFP